MSKTIHMNPLQTNSYPLDMAKDIYNLCLPLQRLGITYFTYLKKFTDGSQIYLSNSGQWIEDYFKLELYKTSLFEDSPDSYNSGYFIWPKEDHSPVFLHARDYFNSDNGITIIEKNINYCEFYFFSGPVKATWLNNFYLNNIDLLKKFIIFFKSEGGRILRKSEKNRLHIHNASNLKSHDHFPNLKNERNVRNEFLSEINAMDIISQDKISIKLSSREKEVAQNILMGKTAQRIADQLVISRKTVERHIENIKNKLNCSNKVELIKRLIIFENNNSGA